MVTVDIFGTCVVRDIFKYTFPERYRIGETIGRNPVSILFADSLYCVNALENMDIISNYEKRCIRRMFNKDVMDSLVNSSGDYLVMDLSEERYDKYLVKYGCVEAYFARTEEFEKVIEQFLQTFYRKDHLYEVKFDGIPWNQVEENYFKFSRGAADIYKEENIIIVESYMVSNEVNNEGYIEERNEKKDICKRNEYLRKCYSLLESYLPRAWRIKFPAYTLTGENHIWGRHPLHYRDSTYQYFANAIDVITGYTQRSTLDKMYAEQCLQNRLFYRNFEMESRIRELEQQITLLNNIIQ